MGREATRERQHDSGVHRAIQHSHESLRALVSRYGINQKTRAKWKKQTSAADLPTGPKKPKSTVLSIEEEAVIVASGAINQNDSNSTQSTNAGTKHLVKSYVMPDNDLDLLRGFTGRQSSPFPFPLPPRPTGCRRSASKAITYSPPASSSETTDIVEQLANFATAKISFPCA
jgi:transposase-like protein